jgi:pilus assembly protein CpaF
MVWLRRRGPSDESPNGQTTKPPPGATGVADVGEDSPVRREDPFSELKLKVHEQLMRDLDLDKVQQTGGDKLREAVEEAAGQLLLVQDVALSRQERLRLAHEIADDVLGLGPLEALLADVTVTEIIVNGPRQIYVERKGLLYPSEATLRDKAHIMRLIEKIVEPIGRRIDESSPMVDARLPDGSRVNAIIPPLAVDGPLLTIRKFARDPLKVDDLIGFGTLTPQIATFLKACVQAKINVVVSGGTGTGKTTLLNVMSGWIPPRERIITIEDVCELQLRQPNVGRLEARPPNLEGRGEVTQRMLVRNALRMRPDRIIVGEVRSGEAFDMLQAMNTGHDGSLTTVHSNTPRDAIARIENMVLMANLELPVRVIREQIASAISLVVHLTRLRDGSRRVTHVTEIVGMEGDTVTTQDVFLFRQQGVDDNGRVRGTITATGIRPKCVERIEQEGVVLPTDVFVPTADIRGDDRWKR